MAQPVVLVVDDNQEYRSSLTRALRGSFVIRTAKSLEEAHVFLSPPPAAVLLDLQLDERDAGNRDGLHLLATIQAHCPQVPVLVATSHGDVESAVEALRGGAVDFVAKGSISIPELKARIAKAIGEGAVHRRVNELEGELALVAPRQIVGVSAAMRQIKREIEFLGRDGNATVLIRGRTGTGKELFARALHSLGRRASAPFVPVMLNALPSSMLESELFGHEPGAFTDARERHIGYLEKAHTGVLMLDEIGEVPPEVQVKLLRAIEQREFQRVGSTVPVSVDVQVVAATNAVLEELVGQGRFREDLYYRLKVHEITIPPLADRPEDVAPLVNHFLDMLRKQGRGSCAITPPALDVLVQFEWPGNVRQLKNTVEAAAFRAEMEGSAAIEARHLPGDLRGDSRPAHPPAVTRSVPGSGFDIALALARDELSYVDQAMVLSEGKKGRAGAILGYRDRFTFSRRLRRIFQRYPVLVDEYPALAREFITSTSDDCGEEGPPSK